MLDDIFPGDSHSKINLELFTYSIAALPPPPPLSASVCTLQESWLRISFCFADEEKKKKEREREKNSPAWSTHLLEGKNTQSWPLEIGRRRAVPALIRGTVNKTVRQRLL